MKSRNSFKKTFVVGPILAAMIAAAILAGCAGNANPTADPGAGGSTASQSLPGSGSPGEPGSASESASGEVTETGGGSDEASAANLAPDETFDAVRGGARLILNYDPAANSFTGTAENTTNSVLTAVRIEVHLSNGAELGPTTPVDLAPGETIPVNLPSTAGSFATWIAHAEVGSGAEAGSSGGATGAEGSGAEGSGAEGPGGEGPGGESGGSAAAIEAANEAAMSSPITPLDQAWNGNLGGLDVSASFDAATQSVQATVRNTLSSTQCYVQSEPHLKLGSTTVGELGPDVLGDLNPGQQATSSVSVSSEPALAGVNFDGYVIHLEVFDCAGPGPQPHTGAQSEGGSGGEGTGAEGAGGEGHGPGGEGSGSESSSGAAGSGSEEGSSAQLAPNETFNMVRSGAHLVMGYDAASNSFMGTVQNTTNTVLTRVRIEVHLSNGTELGPTTPMNMAPGAVAQVILPSTQASFSSWIAHAEVGGAEGGQAGGESGGEHGSGSGGSSGGEGGGEHGSGGEGGREGGSGR